MTCRVSGPYSSLQSFIVVVDVLGAAVVVVDVVGAVVDVVEVGRQF